MRRALALLTAACAVALCAAGGERVSKEFCDRVCQCNAFDPVHRKVPPGYLAAPGLGSYKLYTEPRVWKDANATCARDGGYLAVPDTPQELEVLMSLRYGIKDLHIGFTNYLTDNEFLTSIGTPMNPFQRSLWYRGYPKTSSGRNAVLLYQNGKIWDYRNDQKYPFMCEIPIQ